MERQYIKNVPHESVMAIAEQIAVRPGEIASRTLAQNAAVSLTLMIFLKRLDCFGVTGVSIAGGAGHNIGQLAVAAAVVENGALFYYLPVLLAAGTAAGAVIGLLGGLLIRRLPRRF